MKKQMFLIDGHAIVFRAFYAERTLTSPTGFPTNAIFGFLNSLLRVMDSCNVDYVAVAFDSGRTTFRNDIYPEYKANRAEAPEELIRQIPSIIKLLDAMRIPHFTVQGFEADDILGTLAKRAVSEGYDVVIVTSDKDLFQLVDDSITVYDPWREKAGLMIDAKKVTERLGVRPDQVRDLLALMGDASDNVPGVPKVGPKTAVSLLGRFGTLDCVIARALENADDSALRRVADHVDLARLSQRLTTIRLDVPLDADLERFARVDHDREALLSLLQDLGFASLVPRLLNTTEPAKKKDYKTVLTKEQLESLKAELEESNEFAVDTETTGVNPHLAELIGLSFSTAPDTGYYIPLKHCYLGVPKQLDKNYVLRELRPVLEDTKKRKVGQNLKYDMLVLRHCGITIKGSCFDTMVADYLLRPTQGGHGLDALAFQHLAHQTTTYKELVPPKSAIKDLRGVPIDTVTNYASEDADIAFLLKRKFEASLTELQLDDLFYNIEMPLVSVLADMEMRGVRLSVRALAKISQQIHRELQVLEERIYHLAGEPFTINSPKQLAHILFEKLALPKGRKTKKGYSTDRAVLESLADVHPLPHELLNYRELTKIKSTYADALPKLVNPKTGRIHTSFNQTVTATGRLSSSDPNLQNIPIRSEIGRKIRGAFIPADGYVLASFDYSQIELRLLAHLSGDQELLTAFSEGKDVHKRTAASLFGVPEEEVDRDMRARAKTINFGIIYGMGAFKLARELQISTSKAKQYIEQYFKTYSGVTRMIQKSHEDASSKGYVTTMFGRRRPLPDITSSNRQLCEAAKRAAFNTIIQGTCADIIKLVMIKMPAEICASRLPAHMILQVHDELVFEIEEGHVDQAIAVIKPIMETSVELDVPLLVSSSVGRTWAEAK
ncbi:DNA polymerase I [bacterium]|nr:DNA polymerase I [bacterium]